MSGGAPAASGRVLQGALCPLMGLLLELLLLAAYTSPAQAEPPRGRLGLGAELFSDYSSAWAEGTERFDAFELRRAELGCRFGYGPWLDGELRLEAVRSAAATSLLGLDGNSLVVRVKRVYGGLGAELGPIRLSAEGGLIADPWLRAVEEGYDLRDVSALGGERQGFFRSGDLGVGLTVAGWDRLVSLTVAFGNGEGANQVEQNVGKNVSAVLSVTPWSGTLFDAPAAVRLHAGGREGSLGAGQVRDHRAMGAATFRSARVAGGVEVSYADGFQGRAARQALGVGVWANGSVLQGWLGALLRYDYLEADRSLLTPYVDRVVAGLYSDPGAALGFAPMGHARLYVVYEGELYGADAAALPGAPGVSEVHRLTVTLAFGGEFWVWP